MDVKTLEECINDLFLIRCQTEGIGDVWTGMQWDDFERKMKKIEDALKAELEIQKVDYEVAQKVEEILSHPISPDDPRVEAMAKFLNGENGGLPV